MVRGEEPLHKSNYTGPITERNMNVIEHQKLTAISSASEPGQRPYKLRYVAAFYPTGAAVAIAVGEGEVIVNPADPAVARLLDRLSRQREVALLVDGQQPEVIPHGRMARQQLQSILQRTAVHLPHCRLNWQETLNEFTRPNLAAR